LIALASIPTGAVGDNGAAAPGAAVAYVSSLGNAVFEKSQDRGVPGPELEAYVHDVLETELDVVMFKSLIRERWRTMTQEQRASYQEKIIDFVIVQYVRRLCLKRDRDFTVGETRQHGNDRYFVDTEITSADPQGMETLTWVLKYSDNKFSILDVIFAGISQIKFWRDQFDAYFAQPDNTGIPGLIEFLEKSVDRETADCIWQW
jgi:ABC-type transporter MlaC component